MARPNTAKTPDPAVAIAAERDRLEKYWLGKLRYYSMRDGDRLQLPDYMYTEWYLPEGITREVCVSLDSQNEPMWIPKENAPAPRGTFDPNTNTKSQWELNPTAEMPEFDYTPPAYNSDTHSGGPANFDGQKGGDDNPRNPLLEGETSGQYEAEIADYKARLTAMEETLASLKSASAKGPEALATLINGKS